MSTVLEFTKDNWASILAVLGIAAVLLTILKALPEILLSYLRIRGLRNPFYSEILEQRSLLNRLSERAEPQKKLAAAIEAKKERFLNLPNISFHFCDKERIRDFYNDYFREPTVESMVRELVGEVTAETKGSIPKVLEAKVGGKDLTKWISTLKLPETSLNGMFLRYQRETIKKEQVTLGLELVDVELTQVNEFQTLVDKLRTSFEFPVDAQAIEAQQAKLREKAAEKTLSKLEGASGWVLIEGSFLISDETDGFYRCTSTHPVTEYLSDSAKGVSIQVLLPKHAIESSVAGNYKQSVGSHVPLRVYGEVWQPIDRNHDAWELQITPLAIY